MYNLSFSKTNVNGESGLICNFETIPPGNNTSDGVNLFLSTSQFPLSYA